MIKNSQQQIVDYLKDNPGSNEMQIVSDIWGYRRSKYSYDKKYPALLRRTLKAGKITRTMGYNKVTKRKVYVYKAAPPNKEITTVSLNYLETIFSEFNKKVKCKIGRKYINDALLIYQDKKWFICQNFANGAECPNKMGYKFSWIWDTFVSECYLVDEYLAEAPSTPSPKPMFIPKPGEYAIFNGKFKRIFIAYLSSSKSPFITVHQGGEQEYLAGKTVETCYWEKCEPLPPHVVKINDKVIDTTKLNDTDLLKLIRNK